MAIARQASVTRAILCTCAVVIAAAVHVGSGRLAAAPGVERRADGIRVALDGRYLTIQPL
jgi:hypothetical protein